MENTGFIRIMERVTDLKKLLNEFYRDKDLQKAILYMLSHFQKIERKAGYCQTPMYVKKEIDECIDNVSERKKIIRCITFGLTHLENCLFERKRKIDLSGTRISINYDTLDWNGFCFNDDEVTSACHRFIWMFTDVVKQLNAGAKKDDAYQTCVRIIHSWIDNYKIEQAEMYHSEIFQTYAVAERIVNWLYIIGATATNKVVDDPIIVNSIYNQADYICTHLEYYGEQFTGNHLGNDAKALYIAGACLEDMQLQNIGRKMILHEYERIIVDGGFLREGSSHYQFLITKNYIDIYWVAKQTGDKAFVAKLLPIISRMVQGCDFFLVSDKSLKKGIPFIGDISPDYPPEWIMSVPDVGHWITENVPLKESDEVCYKTSFIGCITDDEKVSTEKIVDTPIDWVRIENNIWTVFSHVNHSLYPNNLTGHFHHDTGAIVAYLYGEPVIIDTGRLTYEDCERGKRDKSVKAHSGICIDNMEPEIDMKTFYSDGVLNKYASLKPQIMQKGNMFQIDVAGYARLRGIDSVIRTVEVEDENLIVTDKILGKGKHEVQQYFHVPFIGEIETTHEYQYATDRIVFEFDNAIKEIEIIRGDKSKVEGHKAEAYGCDGLAQTIKTHLKTELPVSLVTKIKRK